MPRDSSGVYTLPLSNPVTPFTVITTSWANPTMADIAQALTDSLDRYGRGGMLASFKLFDGSIGAPGLSFINQPALGWYREGIGVATWVIDSTKVLTISNALTPRTITPLALEQRGEGSIYKLAGAKSWRVNNDGGLLKLVPSVSVDGEDWDGSKQTTWNPDTGAPSFPTVPGSGYVKITGDTMTGNLQINAALGTTGQAVTGSAVPESAPDGAGIGAVSHNILGGAGSNALYFGAYTDHAQWIQSSYGVPNTAVYDLHLQPLGGKVTIGYPAKAYPFQVGDAADAIGLRAAGAVSALLFGGFQNASDGAAKIEYNRTNGAFQLLAGSRDAPSIRLGWDNNGQGYHPGRFGIGTNSFSQMLRIAGPNDGTYQLGMTDGTGELLIRAATASIDYYTFQDIPQNFYAANALKWTVQSDKVYSTSVDIYANLLSPVANVFLSDANHGIGVTTGQGVSVFTYGFPLGIRLNQNGGNVGFNCNPASVSGIGDVSAGYLAGLVQYAQGSTQHLLVTDNVVNGLRIGFGAAGVNTFDAGLTWGTSDRSMHLWASGYPVARVVAISGTVNAIAAYKGDQQMRMEAYYEAGVGQAGILASLNGAGSAASTMRIQPYANVPIYIGSNSITAQYDTYTTALFGPRPANDGYCSVRFQPGASPAWTFDVSQNDFNHYASGTARSVMNLNSAGYVTINSGSNLYRLNIGIGDENNGLFIGTNSNGLVSSVATGEFMSHRADGNGSFFSRLGLGFRRTDGTVVQPGQFVGGVLFGGQAGATTTLDRTAIGYPASILGIVESAWNGTGDMQTGLSFRTGPVGDNIQTVSAFYGAERMRLNTWGQLILYGDTANPLFYMPGSTLNKIRMDQAAATWQYGELWQTGATFAMDSGYRIDLRSDGNLAPTYDWGVHVRSKATPGEYTAVGDRDVFSVSMDYDGTEVYRMKVMGGSGYTMFRSSNNPAYPLQVIGEGSGTNAGDRGLIAYFSDPLNPGIQGDGLRIEMLRAVAGSDWTTNYVRIGRNVDNAGWQSTIDFASQTLVLGPQTLYQGRIAQASTTVINDELTWYWPSSSTHVTSAPTYVHNIEIQGYTVGEMKRMWLQNSNLPTFTVQGGSFSWVGGTPAAGPGLINFVCVDIGYILGFKAS